MKLFRKKDDLYLSDKPPLTFGGWVLLLLTYAILFAWVFIVVWPIFQIIQASFNGAQEQYIIVGGDTYEFSFRFFKVLFEDTHFLKWVQNTIFIAITTAVLTVIIVSFTGYAYSRYRFKGRKASLMAIMLIQTIPAFAGITAYYTLHTIIVQAIGPMFTRQMMLILIYSAGGIAGNTFILKGYLDSISMELDEAAKIDGCSSIEVYRLIIMPIAKPMLSIIALWSFIGPFMDFMLPRILLAGNVEAYTLAAGLQTLIADIRTMQQPVFAAGGVLTAVPIVIMFALLQKNLISGLAKGAVKG